MPTQTSENTRMCWYKTQVYIRTRMQMCEEIANTSKVSQMRLETQLVPRESNVYVTIKQLNDSKK
jgi:hypothetical protein